MSGNTTNEGYPYPLPTDFADVQDAYRLANAIDANLRSEQAGFRALENRLVFLGRQTVAGSGFTAGQQTMALGVTDVDNTGGLLTNGWKQPTVQQPSWWLFGATIQVAIISGTPVVGDMNMAQLSIATTDQVSGVTTTTNAYQRSDETNTGGEFLNVFTMAAVYRAVVTPILNLNGSTQKACGIGSTFWGVYMGPVT
jgi:hypothetical protein